MRGDFSNASKGTIRKQKNPAISRRAISRGIWYFAKNSAANEVLGDDALGRVASIDHETGATHDVFVVVR